MFPFDDVIMMELNCFGKRLQPPKVVKRITFFESHIYFVVNIMPAESQLPLLEHQQVQWWPTLVPLHNSTQLKYIPSESYVESKITWFDLKIDTEICNSTWDYQA